MIKRISRSRGVAMLFEAALLPAIAMAPLPDAAPAEEPGSPATAPAEEPGSPATAMEVEDRSSEIADSSSVADMDPLRPVTLFAKDIDIRDILSMFSKSRGLNIISGGNVSGRISVDLKEVPFDQALESIVGMAGFQATKQGSIYYVRRPSGEETKGNFLKEVRIYRFNYAVPDQVKPVVEEILSIDGKTTIYTPLRALIVEDWPEVLERVDGVIDALDRAPRQVLIEARVIEARMSEDMRSGIDWKFLFSNAEGSGSTSLEGFTSPPGTGSKGLFLSWGAADFTSIIQSIDGIEDLKTLAAPKVLVVDGSSAEIIIGEQLGFRVVTTVENVVMETVQFLDTGVKLRIAPTITDDGYILMKVMPELSSGQVDQGLPSKTTAQVSTDVLVKDGNTLLIGGLIQERDELSKSGIPFLRKIPIIGFFFGETRVNKSRSELVTLITPRILQPGESAEY